MGADTISGASTLEFESTLAAGQSVNFLGGGGTLDLNDPLGYQGSHIADFVAGDTVDLLGRGRYCTSARTQPGPSARSR